MSLRFGSENCSSLRLEKPGAENLLFRQFVQELFAIAPTVWGDLFNRPV
jgi:hypothetical protein